ncbi:MAG: hypothetical protein H7221_00860 [Flavobacterium sp.]|nr:hypothetical protein [Flavobacterium sp.]
MSRKIFNYSKLVLESVSFDVKLFTKELQKAIKLLLPFEIKELKTWLINFVKEKPELQHSLLLLE